MTSRIEGRAAVRRMPLAVVLAALSLGACGGGTRTSTGEAWRDAARLPRTRAERTGYAETSRHADVVAFIDSLRRLGAPIATGSIGRTTEGREIPYVVASRPLVSTPEQARALGRPVVYVQGNIHGGEVEGKETLQALLRDLVADPRPNVLDSIVLVAVPIYNADGNETWGPQERNRSAQNGPEVVGQRPNAQGLDLNRDYIKVDAPETRASLAMFGAWDPHVFVDLHTTNGSYHGYALTYAASLHPAADIPGFDGGGWTRDSLLPEIRRRVRERRRYETFDYGNFVSNDSVSRGWFTYDHRPRFGTNYYALRGRIAVLSEAYSHDPLARRVAATDAFVRELLSLVAERGGEIQRRTRAASDSAVAWGARIPSPGIALRSVMERVPDTAEVIVERLERTGDSARTEPGVPRGIRRTGDFQRRRIPVYDRFQPELTSSMFWGLVLAERDTAALRLLHAHGVRVDEVVRECRVAEARTLRVDSVSVAPRPFQNRREARVHGSWAPAQVTLAPGRQLVRMSQPLGVLATIMLDPASDDGLATWDVDGRATTNRRLLEVVRLDRPLPGGCVAAP